MATSDRATALLQRIQAGDSDAAAELLPLVHGELRRIASDALRGERVGHTLQTTALLHEAWIRVVERPREFADRAHFLAVAAKAMRAILVDHARRRGARKRGDGAARVELDRLALAYEERAVDLVALGDALDELGGVDAELERVVELRFFGGMSQPEIARATGSSLRSVERAWSTARAWLRTRLAEESA